MLDAENRKLAVTKSDAAKHQTVAAKRLNRIDAHAAHHFLDFMLPCGDEIHKSAAALVGVKPCDKLRALRRNPPVAFSTVTARAEMTAERKQRRRPDIYRVGAERHRLDDVRARTNASSRDNGHPRADSLLAQPCVHACKRKLNRDSHIVADLRGRGARSAAISVDGDDVRTAARDAARNRRDIVNGRHLDDDRLFIFRRLFERIYQLAQILNRIISWCGAGEIASVPSGIMRVRETSAVIFAPGR